MIPPQTTHDAMRFRNPEELQLDALAEQAAPAEWPMMLVAFIAIALLRVMM